MNVNELPIIPHGSSGCCGCLVVRVRQDYADIICNECETLVRTVPVAEVENTFRELARTDMICSAPCPHCGALNSFPGWSSIQAFICRECGKGVSVSPSVQ